MSLIESEEQQVRAAEGIIKELVSIKDFDNALLVARNHIKDSERSDSLKNICIELSRCGKFHRADEVMQSIITSSERLDAQCGIAVSYAEVNDYEKALKYADSIKINLIRQRVIGEIALKAAKQNKVKKFVYASSSSVYGDEPNLTKKEGIEGNLLSPYALTKKVDEEYGKLYTKLYRLDTYGLRYFNVLEDAKIHMVLMPQLFLSLSDSY
jgi:hypothetical protein